MSLIFIIHKADISASNLKLPVISNIPILTVSQFSIMLIPLRDFFRNPEKNNYQISPDGTHISYLAPFADRMNIFVYDLASQQTRRITSIEDRSLMSYSWKGNHTLIFLKDDGGDENFHIYAADLNGENTRDLTPYKGAKAEIMDDLEDHDTDILIKLNLRNPQLFDAYRLNVLSGEMELILENPGGVMGWLSDHNGVLRIAIQSDGINQSILYRPDEHSPFEAIIQTDFHEHFTPLFFDFDNQNVYVATNFGRDKIAIVLYDPLQKVELKTIFEHPDVDADGLHYSHLRKKITVAHYTTWKVEFEFLDSEAAANYDKIMTHFGNTDMEVYVVSRDKTEKKAILRTISDRSLGTYYYYDATSDQLEKLTDVGSWLKSEALCKMQPITYTSRDGLTIHGYLTLPQGREAKNLPVIVHPHGGPWVRDIWRFSPDVQFFANRGYAVLQMNFRGSTGYGKEFWRSSFKQWGLSMQDDISDGVQYLIEQGIADPKRIAIYGASYGGYATLAGITLTPDLYACAIDYVGVSNLFTFLNTIPPYWKPYLDMMYEMVGHPEKDREQLLATSPVYNTDKIKAPLFVAQGAKDPRVNIDESDQIVNALRERGIAVQYMVKENEGHGFLNQENKFEFYEAVEKFLAKHLR